MAALTSAANTGVTEMELIASIVEENRLVNTVILQTATDRSNLLMPGVKSLELPRYATTDAPGQRRFGDPSDQNVDNTTPVDEKEVVFENDRIDLNLHKNLAYTIADRIQEQSRIDLVAELAEQAGKDFARYMDDEVRGQYATLTATVTMSGPADAAVGTNASLSLSDISQAKLLLDKQFVPSTDRFLIISPAMEKAIINIDNFRNADQYGSREALLNGEVGRIYGFTVIMSTLLGDAEGYAVHRNCVNYAIQMGLKFESDRPSVRRQVTEYSFSALWGVTLMDGGAYGVKFEDA